jgi:hypothetical protein
MSTYTDVLAAIDRATREWGDWKSADFYIRHPLFCLSKGTQVSSLGGNWIEAADAHRIFAECFPTAKKFGILGTLEEHQASHAILAKVRRPVAAHF